MTSSRPGWTRGLAITPAGVPPALAWLLVAAGAAVALDGVVALAGAGRVPALSGADGLAPLALAVACSLTALAAAARHRGRLRRGWSLLAAGLGLWAAGQALRCWYQIGEGAPLPWPSVADGGSVAFVLAAAAALWMLAGEARTRGRLRALVDGALVAAALLAVASATVLGDVLRRSAPLSRVLAGLAHLGADVALVTVAVVVLSRTGRVRPHLLLVGLGAVGMAAADAGATYLASLGHGRVGAAVEVAWVAGLGLLAIGAGAARPDRRSVVEGRPARAGAAPLAALPDAVLVLAGLARAGLAVAGTPMAATGAALASCVVGLLIARHYLTVRDNQRLRSAVEAREAQLAHQASHDELTGLPNRVLLHERLARALNDHPDRNCSLALLVCDLDDFKVINDSLGHRAGDDLLVRVGERLRHTIRPTDDLARLGGDEFAVLVEGADAEEVGRRILESLREPFAVGKARAFVRASIGVGEVAAGEVAPAVSLLLSKADTAMHAAKADGKGGLRRYDPSLALAGLEDIELQEPLTDALAAGVITASYQPVVDPHSGRVRSVEALARWQRPEGLVSPGVFVPLAERIGLVAALTDLMLDRSLADRARWSAIPGRDDLRVAVNVSPLELTRQSRLVDRVGAALRRHHVPARHLTLEVTESVVASDDAAATRILAELRALGVRIAIDDFGTGLSSLGRLQQFPVDLLKLDAALTRDIASNRVQSVIVRSVVDLGRRLGMAVVAEGVETPAQLATLRALEAAPQLQGFGLARPMSADAVADLLIGGANLVALAAGEAAVPGPEAGSAVPA